MNYIIEKAWVYIELLRIASSTPMWHSMIDNGRYAGL